MRKRILGTLFGIGLAVSTAVGANAAISPVDISCTNPAGHQPGGQQPSCDGAAHEQESENQNPAGHAPGGHNK
jgi:hypothetical protein